MDGPVVAAGRPGVVYRSARGRWVLLATILGSGLAQLDGTVVNVALPRIGENLDAGLTSLQWTINAYTLTLSGLLLLGGSLGDRLGRRRIFVLGVVWFALASAGCAVAPTAGVLIAMRALQGVGSALLTPGSLAILEAVFRREDRAEAVGAWSGLGGIATAIGPVLGGVLVGVAPWGWRLVFLINLPLAVLVVVVAAAARTGDARRAGVRTSGRTRRGARGARSGRCDLRADRGAGQALADVDRGEWDRRCAAARRVPRQRATPAGPDDAAVAVPLAAVQRVEPRDAPRLCGAGRRAVPSAGATAGR